MHALSPSRQITQNYEHKGWNVFKSNNCSTFIFKGGLFLNKYTKIYKTATRDIKICLKRIMWADIFQMSATYKNSFAVYNCNTIYSLLLLNLWHMEKCSLAKTITTLSQVYHMQDCLIYWYFPITSRIPQLLLGWLEYIYVGKEKIAHPELRLSVLKDISFLRI